MTAHSRPKLRSVVSLSAILLLTACGTQNQQAQQGAPSAGETTTATQTPGLDESPAASETPVEPDAPSSTPADVPSGCASTPNLPSEIDPRVCQETPLDAKQLPTDELNSAHVLSPSENISCGLYDLDTPTGEPFMECVVIEPGHEVAIRGQRAPQAGIDDLADLVVSAPTVTLDYGEVGVNGDFACVSQRIGLSCWHTATKHGVFLSRAQIITW